MDSELSRNVMKLLTVVSIVGIPPTLIAGIYGMNFKGMPELDWKYGYPLAVGIMVGVCGYLYWRFKRSGWL